MSVNPDLIVMDLYQQVPGSLGCTMIFQPWATQADGTLDMDIDGMAYSVYTYKTIEKLDVLHP